MEINGMLLECSEDGSSIYINHHLVDSKSQAKDYFWSDGFNAWKIYLEKNPNYDWKKRHELIKEVIKKQ